MSAPTLETERLILRQTRIDDSEALHGLYSDVAAMRWWSHAPHTTLEETRDTLAERLADPDGYAWSITLRGDDRAIGTLAAREKRQREVAEIGYSLARAQWGKGYAREAVSRLLTHLFQHEKMRRVFADTDPDNTSSNGLLEKLGFTLEGRLRGEWDTHIGVRDSYIWGLLADEWRG